MAPKRRHSKDRCNLLLESLETPHSHRVESTFLIDLRRDPRFDTQFPGEAVAPGGEKAHVVISNVSLSGLQLEGSQEMLGAVLANPDGPTPRAPISLQVSFSLPSDWDQLAAVQVQCRTVYTRRANKDTYQVGMEFLTFDEGREALTEYLLSRRNAG